MPDTVPITLKELPRVDLSTLYPVTADPPSLEAEITFQFNSIYVSEEAEPLVSIEGAA
jgi:hypothetical protein